MQKRRVPVLDHFFDARLLFLWPKFQNTADLHVKSIENADPRALFAEISKKTAQNASNSAQNASNSTQNASNSAQNASNSSIPPICGKNGVAVAQIAVNYAEFAAAVFSVSVLDSDILFQRMRRKIADLLAKIADFYGKTPAKNVFLINNYSRILAIMSRERETAPGPVGGAISGHFGAKLGENGPKTAENGSKTIENGPKTAENGPQTGENGSKTGENGAKTGKMGENELGLEQFPTFSGKFDTENANLAPKSADFAFFEAEIQARAAEYIENLLQRVHNGYLAAFWLFFFFFFFFFDFYYF
jgi:hypothetical protein